MNSKIILLSYGSYANHLRTIFLIYTLYAKATNKNDLSILLFTDSETLFEKYLKKLNINIIYKYTSIDDIKQLRGDIDFIHLVKIKIIQYAMQNYPAKKYLYLDSDMFFMGNISKVLDKINIDKTLMHVKEYSTAKLYKIQPDSEYYTLYRFLESEINKPNNQLFKQHIISWNAGVLGLSSEHFQLLEKVEKLTAEMYNILPMHTCEQHAFSYILNQETKITPTENTIYHYWKNEEKKITDGILKNVLVDDFILKSLNENIKTINNTTILLQNQFKNDLDNLSTQLLHYIKFKYNFKALILLLKITSMTKKFNLILYKKVIYNCIYN